VKWAVVIGIITAFSFGIGYNIGMRKGSLSCIASPSYTQQDADGSESSTSTVAVYVVGEVVKPGVYYLPAGSRIVDAVNLAGGLTASADMVSINMAMKLVDGMQIYVPPINHRRQAKDVSGLPLLDGKIHLNMATEKELESLPGIGPVLAKRIVEYRKMHGPFRRIEDLLKVSGIGAKRFEQIRSYITIP